MIDDRLRGYPHWLASAQPRPTRRPTSRSRRWSTAVRDRYELPRRWYRLKAQLLGLDRLADYDRMAAVTDENPSVAWREARDARAGLLLERSPPSSATIVNRFFDEALDRRAGAARQARRRVLLLRACRRVHPYVMLNYTLRCAATC